MTNAGVDEDDDDEEIVVLDDNFVQVPNFRKLRMINIIEVTVIKIMNSEIINMIIS